MGFLAKYACQRITKNSFQGNISKASYQRNIITTLLTLCCFMTFFQAPVAFAQTPHNRQYVFKSDVNCPPFEYVENGNLKGFSVELLQAIAEVMNLNIRFEGGVWSEIRTELESGVIDGLTGMMYSEERSRYADFSMPHNTISYALFVRQDSAISNLEGMEGRKVAVQEGDIAHEYLLSSGFTGAILTFPTAEEALIHVALGKCEGALIGHVHGLYILRNPYFDMLTAGDIALPLNQDCCFAVSKGNEWLLGQINEGLRVLKGSGQYNEIHQRWLGFAQSQRHARMFFYISITLVIIIGVILTIFIWAQLLRRQVRRRTVALKHSEERYRLLVDKLPDGILVLRDN